MPPFRGLKAKPPSKKVDYLLLDCPLSWSNHHVMRPIITWLAWSKDVMY